MKKYRKKRPERDDNTQNSNGWKYQYKKKRTEEKECSPDLLVRDIHIYA